MVNLETLNATPHGHDGVPSRPCHPDRPKWPGYLRHAQPFTFEMPVFGPDKERKEEKREKKKQKEASGRALGVVGRPVVQLRLRAAPSRSRAGARSCPSRCRGSG